MIDIKALVQERDLSPYHSFFAAFFGGLAELGTINQGTINIVSRRAADYFYAYLDAKDLLPNIEEVPGGNTLEVAKNLILYINRILKLVGQYDFQVTEGDQAVLLLAGDTCRICPKGVGGAEVRGTLCPLPTLLESLINSMAGQPLVKLTTEGIEKDGPTCKAHYRLLA